LYRKHDIDCCRRGFNERTDGPHHRQVFEKKSNEQKSEDSKMKPQEIEVETNQANLVLKQVPITKTGMLIRKPVAEVFEAFINPDITTRFWFTKSSGRLATDQQFQWGWEMYGISIPVDVKAIESNKRIVIEWAGYSGQTTVEWTFSPQKDGTTFVNITESGFTGDGDELVKHMTASTQGFSLVLAGLKALLEHNVRLNLVADRYPKGIEEH